jgi:hypothetical protein
MRCFAIDMSFLLIDRAYPVARIARTFACPSSGSGEPAARYLPLFCVPILRVAQNGNTFMEKYRSAACPELAEGKAEKRRLHKSCY